MSAGNGGLVCSARGQLALLGVAGIMPPLLLLLKCYAPFSVFEGSGDKLKSFTSVTAPILRACLSGIWAGVFQFQHRLDFSSRFNCRLISEH
ncbi:hypothetical protein G8764_22285 [Pseudomaricurvus alcaniphilus]|uniref:hypothetical protein n=1 Tax=Pseudomaricurvus alcaniphilus TaxID=1166482 RepID=UPI00140C9F7E|nr:hypothetical protein [Pseudomaricurvus alcaniphilus]NHN40025.1 hypothetical protein [Pseudomaricurvus alcaniphilus]